MCDSSLCNPTGGGVALHAHLRWAPEWTVISQRSSAFLPEDFSQTSDIVIWYIAWTTFWPSPAREFCRVHCKSIYLPCCLLPRSPALSVASTLSTTAPATAGVRLRDISGGVQIICTPGDKSLTAADVEPSKLPNTYRCRKMLVEITSVIFPKNRFKSIVH